MSTIAQLPSRPASPTLIGRAGKSASLHFLEFFTVNVRNPNTRAAYGRAAARRSLPGVKHGPGPIELSRVQPIHVAAYIEERQSELAPPTVKQHLACLRMLFDWLATGQVIPSNPAHAVRGPVSKGATARCCFARKSASCSKAWMFQPWWVCAIARSSPP